MEKYVRIGASIVLAVIIVLSCTVVGRKLTDPATYCHTIEVLDNSRSTVLGLSAASAAASAAVSALPSDICSPMAQQLSEFTTWFLVILSVLFLEKYLLTILASVACYILLPAGCGSLLINCFFPTASLKSFGRKMVIFGAALLLVIPSSVWVSDQINDIYCKSIDMAVQSANTVSENLMGEISIGNDENTTVIDEAKTILDDLSGSVSGVIKQFKHVLNRFVEAIAVMLVTTCLIPILVIAFFIWIIKTLFSFQIILPSPPTKPFRKHLPRERECTPSQSNQSEPLLESAPIEETKTIEEPDT